MKIRPAVITAVAFAGLLAGCANVVDGSGNTASTGGSSSPDFPSQSASRPTATSSVVAPSSSPAIPTPSLSGSAGTDFACPAIVFPSAHLSFECITTGLTATTADKVWPLTEYKRIESTGWAVEMGSGHWGAEASDSLSGITETVRRQMLDRGSYGTSPTVTTTASVETAVDGARAHLLKTTFTLNRAYAAKRGTKVRVEKSWIIAIEVAPNDVSLWYASIPDLVKYLWARIPAAVATIRLI